MKGWRNHPAVYLVSTITALSLFGDSLLYSVLPLYADRLGIPLMAVGVILSLNRWIRLLTNPLSARIYQRLGIFRPLVMAATLTVVSTFLYSRAWGLAVFLIARAIWGFCWSHLRLGSFLIILGTSASALGLAMGTHHAVTRLGSAFTTLFGGMLVDSLGYQSGLTIMALLSALALPLIFYLRSMLGSDRIGLDQEVVEQKQAPTPPPPELSSFLCNAAAFVNSFVGAGLIVSSLSLILNQRIGNSVTLGTTTLGIATISGALFAVRWTSNLILSPIAGRLTDVFGRKRAFLGLTASMVLLLALFGAVTNPWLTVFIACLMFFSGNSLEVVLDAAIGDASHGDPGGAGRVSRYASFYDLGAACGPVVGYFLGARFGFSWAYYIGAGMMGLLLAGYLLGAFPEVTEEKRRSASS